MLLFFGASARCGEHWALQNKDAAVLMGAGGLPPQENDKMSLSPDVTITVGLLFIFPPSDHAARVEYRGKAVAVNIVYADLCTTNYVIEVDPTLLYGVPVGDRADRLLYTNGVLSIESVDYLSASDNLVDGVVTRGLIRLSVRTSQRKSFLEEGLKRARKQYCPAPSV
ncbi:MAG: hypothetical protein KGI60_02160 [Patescibacteria group bacterium]|nr:hypothetical protein [Patescibacteria group bacterium]